MKEHINPGENIPKFEIKINGGCVELRKNQVSFKIEKEEAATAEEARLLMDEDHMVVSPNLLMSVQLPASRFLRQKKGAAEIISALIQASEHLLSSEDNSTSQYIPQLLEMFQKALQPHAPPAWAKSLEPDPPPPPPIVTPLPASAVICPKCKLPYDTVIFPRCPSCEKKKEQEKKDEQPNP